MRIPPIEKFREEDTTAYGLVWSADLEGTWVTLTLPAAEPVRGDAGWEPRPHEPSYRLVFDVLPELDALQQQTLDFLARIVDFERLRLPGEPFVAGLHCDARSQKVVVALTWTEDRYGDFSVTFQWSPDEQFSAARCGRREWRSGLCERCGR